MNAILEAKGISIDSESDKETPKIVRAIISIAKIAKNTGQCLLSSLLVKRVLLMANIK